MAGGKQGSVPNAGKRSQFWGHSCGEGDSPYPVAWISSVGNLKRIELSPCLWTSLPRSWFDVPRGSHGAHTEVLAHLGWTELRRNTSWTACAEKVLFAGNEDYRVGWIKAKLSDSSWRSFTPPFIWEGLTAAGSDIWSGVSGRHVACLHSATSGPPAVVPGSHLIFHLPWWCKTEFQCSHFEKNTLPRIKSGLWFPNTEVSRCLSKCDRCSNVTISFSQVCENRGGGSVTWNMADRQVCPNSHPCCRPHGSNIHCTVPQWSGRETGEWKQNRATQ